MVWEQYVYEASNGAEVYNSDDDFDEDYDDVLHIEDWRDFNSDHLEYMWGILRQYLYDAGYPSNILRYASFEDFVRFCYDHS